MNMLREIVGIGLILMCLTCGAGTRILVRPSIPLAKEMKGHYAANIRGTFTTWGGYWKEYNAYVGDTVERYGHYAFGTSVDVAEGAIYIGGMNAEGATGLCLLRKFVPSMKSTSLWRVDPTGLENLTLLPHPVWRAAGLTWEGYIYVAGGLRDSVNGNESLFRMAWPKGKEWECMSKMPGKPRVSPLMIGDGDGVMVIGGCLAGGDTLAYETWQHTGLTYSPALKEWKEKDWTVLPDSLFPAAGGVAMPIGRFETLFFGGQERDGRYRQHAVIYNRLFDRWVAIEGDKLLARTDAALTKMDGVYLLSGGEVAKGVRTGDVSYIIVRTSLLPAVWSGSEGWIIGWSCLVCFSLTLILFFAYKKRSNKDRGEG